MAELAIKGHKTRGNEVVKLLEMLGGENIYNKSCSNDSLFYYISDEDCICELPISESYKDFILFTLEEFLEEHPHLYEVGDEVFIKGKNKKAIVHKVVWCCDTVTYWLKYDGIIEGNRRAEHLQPYKEDVMEEKLMPRIDFAGYCKDKYIIDLGNYEIKKENGKTYAVRKQSEYPGTFIECAKILDCSCATCIDGYKWELLEDLQKLLICRDAYWKIAGEKMGLGRPWEPDWTNETQSKYSLYDILKDTIINPALFVFPTKEMRDSFYENFKNLLEHCK